MDCPKCGGYICTNPEIVGDDRTCPVCANAHLASILTRAVKRTKLDAVVRADLGNIGVSVDWRGLKISVTYERGAPRMKPSAVDVYRAPAPGWLPDKAGGHRVDISKGGVTKLAAILKRLTAHK